MLRNTKAFQTTSLLEAAQTYLCLGWSPIPIRGKQPALASWKQYQTKAPSPVEINQWFSSLDPSPTGVAVITGRISRLTVIDCDTAKAAELWTTHFPESPLVTRTGGGGVHIYYQAPTETVRNRVNIGGHQIDIRGEGGYVVAAPSSHNNGSAYTWQSFLMSSKLELPVFDPKWLTTFDYPGRPGTSPSIAEPLRNVAAYIARIHAVAGRGGHSATFRAACKLRDAGLSSRDALLLLTKWNETNAEPPWSAAELSHKIKSAYQVGGLAASD